MKKKEKVEIVYTLSLRGEELNGPSDLPFYDVVKEPKEYAVRYYGACKVHSSKTKEDAIEYIYDKAGYMIGESSTEIRNQWRKQKYETINL